MPLLLAFIWLPVPVDWWATRPAITVSYFLFLGVPGSLFCVTFLAFDIAFCSFGNFLHGSS
ncbi:hypothetical protein A2U01_0073636, partial [Trifolium medium]|nr:hypothetical protein [Trifolium medium]